MAGLVPAIHVLKPRRCKGVDPRNSPGITATEIESGHDASYQTTAATFASSTLAASWGLSFT